MCSSLCSLRVLRVSVVQENARAKIHHRDTETTKAAQRKADEKRG